MAARRSLTEDEILEQAGLTKPNEDTTSSDSNRSLDKYRNVETTESKPSTALEIIFLILTYIFLFITFPLSIWGCFAIMQEYQRAVVLRFGRLRPGGPRGPGILFFLPCVDNYVRVDLRTTSVDVPPQDILTRDSVTVTVDAVVYYRVSNPLDAVLQVQDPRTCCQLLAMTTLRNITGTYMLIELVQSKKSLSKHIKQSLDNTRATDPWGLRIERVEITDIFMPESLQRSMAIEQEARREALAKVAAANGERDAVKALKEAADIMASNPIAFQLRFLQTLNTISNEETDIYVFPLPIDVVSKLIK
ncbi:CG14644 [Drosophila busckii]|uniref:CG14644 n=1 Tax=Drosophila busckii TaxID=30019 RepID=A0A0M4E7S8_DROBS|nr:band 7 protein AGAP004871 [Drosophila busckii]ALC42816.1 CG14644 [Drosophila busckii]